MSYHYTIDTMFMRIGNKIVNLATVREIGPYIVRDDPRGVVFTHSNDQETVVLDVSVDDVEDQLNSIDLTKTFQESGQKKGPRKKAAPSKLHAINAQKPPQP